MPTNELLAEVDFLRDQIAALKAENESLLKTMDELARLGNGDQYGNSDGNRIAQAAIAKVRGKEDTK